MKLFKIKNKLNKNQNNNEFQETVKLKDLTSLQFKNWHTKNCHGYECKRCIFKGTECNPENTYLCWVENKNIFNKKFLNKKITIQYDILLTLEEKTELEAMLLPIKDKIISLRYREKVDSYGNQIAYLEYVIKCDYDNTKTEDIALPTFKKGSKYKKLNIYDKYTLKDLHLFEF